MKDALLVFLFAALSFPLGIVLALFIHWMDKQKRPPRRRSATAIPWGIAIIGIGTNLIFAVLNAARHNQKEMDEHLFMAVFFVLATWGAWVVTRHPRIEPSSRPNYRDDI